MFKKDKDYEVAMMSGRADPREGISLRLLTLAALLAAAVLWEECVGALPIEFSLLAMACLMVDVWWSSS